MASKIISAWHQTVNLIEMKRCKSPLLPLASSLLVFSLFFSVFLVKAETEALNPIADAHVEEINPFSNYGGQSYLKASYGSNSYAPAEEETEVTAHPGQTITDNKLSFENVGNATFSDVYAVASGEAVDWVSQTTIQFGTVYPGQKVWRTYTITVPSDATIGLDYTLTWTFYSERGYEDSVYQTIHVTSQDWVPWWIWIVIALVLVVIPVIVLVVVVGSRRRVHKKPVTRICPQCGRPLPLDVKFCPYCGKTLGG